MSGKQIGLTLDNVGIHTSAKFDQYTPCDSRVMSIFTD